METNLNNAPCEKRAAFTKPVSIRFTEEELSELKIAAGDLPVSEYVRRQLFSNNATGIPTAKATENRLSPQTRQKLLVQILARLGHQDAFGTLNDLLTALQSGLIETSPELISALITVHNELSTLRSDLLKALGLRP